MSNKIFYISVILILMVGCDWKAIADKSIEISDKLLIKDKDKTKNQDRIEVNEDNYVSRNNTSIDGAGIASLEHLISVDLINHSQQVIEPMISNNKTIAPQARIDLMNNVNVDQINPKPAQSLENPLHNATTEVNIELLTIENQERISKKTLPSKLENLEGFLETQYEKEAFKKAKATQSLISNSNIEKEIVKFKEEYYKLYNLFGNMQEKFHSQRNSFIRDTKFGENRKKNTVIFRSFSSIEKEIRSLNHKLTEIQSNFQISDDSWNNANSLLKESIEKLIQAIEKRHNNEGRKQGQIGGPANRWDRNQADNFAKDAKYKAEYSANALENAANYFRYSCSNKKEAKKLLEEIEKRFLRIGIHI
ncbi:hypothetical protein QIA00_05185 (plasmid) [Borreliella americana]|uniref:Uncharacterized protein n=1 Tax=Borreliella americana TaxID=478807 RepID=A0ACD5G648_9SPIR